MAVLVIVIIGNNNDYICKDKDENEDSVHNDIWW